MIVRCLTPIDAQVTPKPLTVEPEVDSTEARTARFDSDQTEFEQRQFPPAPTPEQSWLRAQRWPGTVHPVAFAGALVVDKGSSPTEMHLLGS